uniref:Uncharacterized protein n=1 Tax=Noctiluca scintillans TaxID=2966 RepID=A0A7S1ARL1_NOCSC|mmetsp:Transcript_57261/g.152717  ORF Transcript_57261/g.152717 Transcript_57261/m.152717 type:complete len:124 (+) Transcript_57261:3-374(+)
MVSQLRASRAQLMQLAATFNWNVRRGEICQHFEARDRAENFVHLRGPLRAMAFNPTEFGEEIGFCSVCVCHSIDDDFGIFIHIEHDSNTSKTYDDTGTPVNLKDIPNPAVKEMFSKHQRFFSR